MAMGTAHPRRLRGMLAVGVAALVLAAGCSGGGSSGSSVPAGGTPVKGGTAVFAETPSTTPNYIFPFVASAYISDANIQDFQHLMYRPLYWFGSSGRPVANESLSLADPPVFNGAKVTINLKHYLWSNGQPVTATDVMFWLNMEQAVPASYGAYTGFPANVKDITVVSPTELTMTMLKPYNHTWFLYNDLSQITPDAGRLGPDRVGPEQLRGEGRRLPGGVQLPERAGQEPQHVRVLTAVVDRGRAVEAERVQPRRAPHHDPERVLLRAGQAAAGEFQEVPFPTDSAEYAALRSPGSGTKINVGYLPQGSAPARRADAAAGSNPVKGYFLSPWPVWGINYFVVNYQSTVSGHAAIIKQLYFRQALEYLMNQAAVIRGPLHGYGVPTIGPVATNPVTSFLSPQGKTGNQYPFSPAKAKKLLTSHGWQVVPTGSAPARNRRSAGPGSARAPP